MSVRHSDKHMRILLKEASRNGHSITCSRGHFKVTHKNTGQSVSISSSPSGFHAHQNAARDLVRGGFIDSNPFKK